MRALLDINVLIALLDAGHQNHAHARDWLVENIGDGWASCPITQNGCVRILSQPAYPNSIPTSTALEKLRRACATDQHEFWSDDASLLDASLVRIDRIHGPTQLTDVYLLALAVRRRARFVTLDARVASSAVRGATAKHLVSL